MWCTAICGVWLSADEAPQIKRQDNGYCTHNGGSPINSFSLASPGITLSLLTAPYLPKARGVPVLPAILGSQCCCLVDPSSFRKLHHLSCIIHGQRTADALQFVRT